MAYIPERRGQVSSGNSTTTPLGIGATFTGAWEDISNFASTSVSMDTDVGGTLNMQVSTDGVNPDKIKTIEVPAGGGEKPHLLTQTAQYFRVVYTNGSVAQTHFRLQTNYHTDRAKDLTHTTNQPIDKRDDVSLVRTANEHYLDIAQGLLTDQKVIHKFGRNPAVGASHEDIWTVGGTYTWLTSAATLEAISSDANDTAAGTGARTIVVEGLDGSFNEISETITMNGTSASAATSNSFLRVNRAYVATTGSYATSTTTGSNAGNITIRISGGGATQAEILDTVGYGQTQVARYSVPAGKTAHIRRVIVTVDSTKTANLFLWKREGADVTSAPFTPKRIVGEFDSLSGQTTLSFDAPIVIPEKSDIWFSATASASSAVTTNVEIILIDD